MKKIYIALFALLAVGSTFTACTEEEPFATVTENDDPHILAPVFPDRTNGQLATFANISRDANLSIALALFLTAMPTRSQSGSVASSKSALHFLAYSMPSAIASLISGFGYGQVGKFPSGCSCSLTTVMLV